MFIRNVHCILFYEQRNQTCCFHGLSLYFQYNFNHWLLSMRTWCYHFFLSIKTTSFWLIHIFQSRSHTCGLPDEFETEFCNTFEGVFSDWTTWSPCPVTCGGGVRSRRRSHTCGLDDEDDIEVRSCLKLTINILTRVVACYATPSYDVSVDKPQMKLHS